MEAAGGLRFIQKAHTPGWWQQKDNVLCRLLAEDECVMDVP